MTPSEGSFATKACNQGTVNSQPSASVLLHLHPDFQDALEYLLDAWNTLQHSWRFIGLRPGREIERILLTPGAISDDEASRHAADMRAAVGHAGATGIIIFTEKRLFDEDYYQLFVGGREADEEPPRVAVLSLDFLRKMHRQVEEAPVLFRAIVSNILFSLGIDCGLEDLHGNARGCIMDFCMHMPDIEMGLRNGPRFCDSCSHEIELRDCGDLLRLSAALRDWPNLANTDSIVSESIRIRGERYKRTDVRFDYDVAISFSGPERECAERLARALQAKGVAVFYDRFDQAELWGKNLHIYLSELYRLRSKYCVVFLSANYGRDGWTRVELDAALAREFQAGHDYILPIRLDDSDVPGILPTRGYIDWRRYSVDAIADLVRERLANQPLQRTALARRR